MRVILALLLALIALPALAYEWEYLGMDGIDATTLTGDDERERVLVGTYEGFWIYDQAAESWLERDEEGWIGRQVWAIDFDDDLPDRIITGRENAFFKGYLEYSDDLGATGNFVYESTGGRVTDITHFNPPRHFACTWSDIAPGELLRSTNGGESWTPLAGHGFQVMTDLTSDPATGALVVAGDAGVKRSFDWGESWEDLTGDLPVSSIVHCAQGAYGGGDVFPDIWLVAGVDAGIYFSEQPGIWHQQLDVSCRRIVRMPVPVWAAPDRLAAVSWDGRVIVSQWFTEGWSNETGDLPGTPIDVVFSSFDGGLYVLTAEHGLWRRPNVVVAAEAAPADAATLAAHPNPFNPTTTLRFRLPAAGYATLRVYDVSGHRVATLFDGSRPAGVQSVVWDAGGLPGGVYLARLAVGVSIRTTRLVLLK